MDHLSQTSAGAVRLVQITAPHFCAGIIAIDGRVVGVAPILAYMKNWTGLQVKKYCARKGWVLTGVSV